MLTGYVIVGGFCLIIGACIGVVIAALCVAGDENGLNIEYRTWSGKDE